MNKVVMAVAMLILAALIGFSIWRASHTEDGVACTLEAKLCPDGTAVGRIGPNCEFALCP